MTGPNRTYTGDEVSNALIAALIETRNLADLLPDDRVILGRLQVIIALAGSLGIEQVKLLAESRRQKIGGN